MSQEVPNTVAETQVAAACRHHWVIQPATGPVSQGSCQVCGQTKEFKNYVEASTWGDDRGAGRPRRGHAPAPEAEVGEFMEDGEAA